jgi:hypothetical protein
VSLFNAQQFIATQYNGGASLATMYSTVFDTTGYGEVLNRSPGGASLTPLRHLSHGHLISKQSPLNVFCQCQAGLLRPSSQNATVFFPCEHVAFPACLTDHS